MLRFDIRSLIRKLEAHRGDRISLSSLADEIGLDRMILSRIVNAKNETVSTSTQNIDIILQFFVREFKKYEKFADYDDLLKAIIFEFVDFELDEDFKKRKRKKRAEQAQPISMFGLYPGK